MVEWLTITEEEPTFTVAGKVVVPGVIAMALTMVVPFVTPNTAGSKEDHLGDSCGHWPLVQLSRSSLGSDHCSLGTLPILQ